MASDIVNTKSNRKFTYQEGFLKPNIPYRPEVFTKIIDDATGTTEQQRLQAVYDMIDSKKIPHSPSTAIGVNFMKIIAMQYFANHILLRQ